MNLYYLLAITPLTAPQPGTFPSPQQEVSPYRYPGTVGLINGQWAGRDNLLMIGSNIGIVVEIVKDTQATLALTEDTVRSWLETIFTRSSIIPSASGDVPTPFFKLLFIIGPADKDMVSVSITASLFESGIPKRRGWEPQGQFQVITWQRELLLTKPPALLMRDIQPAVVEVMASFMDAYNAANRKN